MTKITKKQLIKILDNANEDMKTTMLVDGYDISGTDYDSETGVISVRNSCYNDLDLLDKDMDALLASDHIVLKYANGDTYSIYLLKSTNPKNYIK